MVQITPRGLPLSAHFTNIIPVDEAYRMAAVQRYDILDTPPDGSFDRITAIASRMMKVPISIVSIVDHDRIWFKSHHGVPVQEIGRDPGLCASAILSLEPHILEDARADPRSLANPLVAGEFGLRFYAGVPLRTHDGYNLGTLCVIDKEPRPITQDQIDDLKDLASVVMDQLELRLSSKRAVARAEIMAREIDHRVMNSLQFVSALLNMQSRIPDLTDAAGQLQMAASRVGSIARVHRHFYTDEGSEATSCITFLRRLCADLSTILGSEIEVDGDEGEVPTRRIQPIGLITNELVTNAVKHGGGKVRVSFRISEGMNELAVRDEGIGLPGGLDLTNSTNGLGMRVVRALAKQLGGSIGARANTPGQGSCVSVTFPT
jgi:two-component sensor histidine kinase